MDRDGTVSVLEIFPNVFDEVRGEIVVPGENVQAERFFGRCGSLRGGDFAVMRHQREDKIASRQGALGMASPENRSGRG